MPDYRLKTRATSKESMAQLGREIANFADHAINHLAALSNPRFVSGYFVITCDVTIPQAWLDHVNLEAVP